MLLALLVDCPDALAADFHRYYQACPAVMARQYGLLRVAACAAWLPKDAAVWRATSPDDGWSLEAHLLAVVADRVAALHHLTLRAHGGRGPAPAPIPRPGAATGVDPDTDRVAGEAFASISDIDAWYTSRFPNWREEA